MKRILVFLLLFAAHANAKSGIDSLKEYFKEHKGGACLVPATKWLQFGIDHVGRPCGQFIISEQDMEDMLAIAKKRGGNTGNYDMKYIDSCLGLPPSNVDVLHFYLPYDTLIKLHIRFPEAKDSCGANEFFMKGGKTSGGIREAFIDSIPAAMLVAPPNAKGINKYAIIYPLINTDTCKRTDSCNTKKATCHAPGMTCLGFGGWLLVFLPVIFFLVMILMFRNEMKGLKLKDALSENSDATITTKNEEYSVANIEKLITAMKSGSGQGDNSGISPTLLANIVTLLPPTVQVSKQSADDSSRYRPSSSRIIAFISGMILLAVAMGLSSFYIYFYMRTGIPPELSQLSGVLIALGLGMAPYAINKVSGVVGSGKE